ncbi:hypothetical protein MUU47_11240 [Scandinavium sp. H11S7]|uniref:Uncharacterized protein n=1 Tax=Scandinavium hiltneri TaxID=2926519 RepID=A0ABT2E1U6_9ENTR|nr:hypothetical protein [Scandinavium hiltneri]MCS2161681.1 hypothetical protein [Scandinavium hiltneri]
MNMTIEQITTAYPNVAKLESQAGRELLAQVIGQMNALAAENAEFEKRMRQLIQIINNADNDYCMCGDAMKNHAHGGCGHPTGMFDYHYNKWLESGNKTPATDAFLAEVRAQGVGMFAESLPSIGDTEVNTYEDGVKAAFETIQRIKAPLFAAQLRQGAAL